MNMNINRQLNVYFDTEFTGLRQNTDLISIGLISERGDCFYAELTDYNKDYINEWINDNVIANLEFKNVGGIVYFISSDNITKPLYNQKSIKSYPTKSDVSFHLNEWLNRISNNGEINIKLISDVCHYDMVLFAELFGGAMNLPSFVSPACHDINQDIERFYNISQKKAFDIPRGKIINSKISLKQHNSLFDALLIKQCYHALNKDQ